MTQQEIQTKLEELLGSENVYFQPPENIKIKYPAIIYKIARQNKKLANDAVYGIVPVYEMKVVDYVPDSWITAKLLEDPKCSFVAGYCNSNLHYDVLNIY